MKELNIKETIDDLRFTIDKLKEQLIYVVNEDLNLFVKHRIRYYQNIINWLEQYQDMCAKQEKENDDLK